VVFKSRESKRNTEYRGDMIFFSPLVTAGPLNNSYKAPVFRHILDCRE